MSYQPLEVSYMTIPVYLVGKTPLLLQARGSHKLQQWVLFLCDSAVPVICDYLICDYLICVGNSNVKAGYAAKLILSVGRLFNHQLRNVRIVVL